MSTKIAVHNNFQYDSDICTFTIDTLKFLYNNYILYAIINRATLLVNFIAFLGIFIKKFYILCSRKVKL